jgi:hypothetical protein
MDELDPKVVTSIVAAVSAITGAAIVAYGKARSARHKLEELRESYEQRLQETYLQNARAYTQSIYIPLSILLSDLSYAFHQDRMRRNSVSTAEGQLLGAIELFNSGVSDLLSRGAGAFLTAELDERLRAFCSFLDESKDAEVPTLKMVVGFSLPFFGTGFRDEVERRITGRFARSLWSPRLSLRLGGLGLSYEANEVLAAPLLSKDFEERFVRETHILNVLVKEVTLGAKSKDGQAGSAR